jgi:AraC-like DNA-binding protein
MNFNRQPAKFPRVAAFEKVPFENDSSILWKHVVAQRFRFVYHYHPEIELILFVAGDGLEFVGNSSQTFKDGHLVLLGSNLPHFWVNDPGCQYAEACVIQFKSDIFGEGLLQLPELARIKSLLENASRGVAFSRLLSSETSPLMTRLGTESGAKRLLTLLEILSSLSRDTQSRPLCATSYKQIESHNGNRRVGAIYRYLSEHFRERCPLAEVAKAVGMNDRTFSRVLRQEAGRSYIDILIEIRLSYACRLLRETDKTIAEIAYECGFTNLANFNRQFRGHYQLTPKEYRHHWAEEDLTAFTRRAGQNARTIVV